MSRDRHNEIASLLKRRLDELRNRDGPVPHEAHAPVDRRATKPDSEGMDAEQIRNRWLASQTGSGLKAMLGGRESNRFTGLIEVSTTMENALKGSRPVLPRLDGELWLVPGIREATMRRLAESGFTDIASLASHPRFGMNAKRVQRLIDRSDPARLADLIGSRAGRGNILSLSLAGLFDTHEVLFLDIETMGLFGGSPIIQAGLARINGSAIEVRQLVARTPDAEAGLIRETCDEIESCRALVTFNGRSFDFPYVCQRSAFYGNPLSADPVHFDLLPYARRIWRGKTTNCRLSTLAREVLGMERDEDVDGSLVPVFYRDYLEDPESRYGLLAGIVSHNRDDMVEMVRLYERLLAEIPGFGI